MKSLAEEAEAEEEEEVEVDDEDEEPVNCEEGAFGEVGEGLGSDPNTARCTSGESNVGCWFDREEAFEFMLSREEEEEEEEEAEEEVEEEEEVEVEAELLLVRKAWHRSDTMSVWERPSS